VRPLRAVQEGFDRVLRGDRRRTVSASSTHELDHARRLDERGPFLASVSARMERQLPGQR